MEIVSACLWQIDLIATNSSIPFLAATRGLDYSALVVIGGLWFSITAIPLWADETHSTRANYSRKQACGGAV
jgi:hypothetical protein